MLRPPAIFLRTLLAAALVLAALAPRASAVPSQAELDQALRDLGDDHFDVRERATQTLFSAGLVAIPALRKAASGDDPEVRSRAEKVLDRFARGVYADTPADIADLADRYLYAEASERSTILAELSRRGGYGYLVLSKLVAQEQDLWLRGQATQLLADHADALPQSASVLLQQGDADGAERLLATGAAAENDLAIRAYAAVLRDRNKLLDAAAALQARVDREPTASRKTLIYFYRAAGDLPKAAAVAEKAGDPALIETIALERRDWKRLALSLKTAMVGQPADLRRLGFLATVQRFAGDEKEFQSTLADILRIHATNPGNYWPVATTLLLNDQLQQATDLLIDQNRYVTAFELLSFSGKFDDAIALLAKARADDHPDAATLMAMAARLHWRMGDAQKARNLLDEMSTLSGRTLAAYIAQVDVEREIGRTDPALLGRARADMITTLRIADGAPRTGGNGSSVGRLFEKVYLDRAPIAASWWSLLGPVKSAAPDLDAAWEAAVAQLERIMGNQLTPEEWQGLFAKVDDPITRSSDPTLRLWRLEQLVDGLDAAGQTALADKCFARLHDVFKLAQNAPRELYLFVPKRQVRRGQFAAAVEDCKVCAAQIGRTPDLRWLQGWALHLAGDKTGDEQMALAAHCTLGDDNRIANLADMMADHDHPAEAMAVRAQELYVGTPRSIHYYDVLWRKAQAAAKTDPATAAACWQSYALVIPDAGGVFNRESAYFEIPRANHIQHARSLYQHGELAPAMDELRALQARSPLSVEVALDCVPELQKLHHDAAARELFDLAYKALDAFCAKHPDAAFFHNEIAWLAVRSGYELDAALVHAHRAVHLAPRETNSLDTLAEIYFRRGDRDRAVALMKQCESLEPHQPRHRQRREEFEKGAAGRGE